MSSHDAVADDLCSDLPKNYPIHQIFLRALMALAKITLGLEGLNMTTRYWIEKLFHWVVDHWFAHKRQAMPLLERLENCKIISHRGEHDNRHIFENTLQAFDVVKNNGIWGLEFDVRWTKDRQPVVIHDIDTGRVFGQKVTIRQLTKSELISDFPLIPALEDVIQTYGKKLHLLVELKTEAHANHVHQNRVLADLFSPLEPGIDFHIISMAPEVLDTINFVPTTTLLPVAKLNPKKLSDLVIQKNYGGILAQYLILNDTLLRRHQNLGHHTGTGYIGSKYCLFRELNRQVEWLFSNNATEIRTIRNSLLGSI
jgi:glycerophosphoryl diester phosphodiesterase